MANPKPALIRYLNAGSVSYPFHPHGSDEQLIARDGHAAQGPGGQDLSFANFLIDVAPGQTADTLMVWKDAEHWNAASNPIPVPLPQLQDQIVGPGTETWFSENPYLGARRSGRATTRCRAEQRMRRVLPRGPQPRPRTVHQLRRELRRDDDPHPHRSSRRLPRAVRPEGIATMSLSVASRVTAVLAALALVVTAAPKAARAARCESGGRCGRGGARRGADRAAGAAAGSAGPDRLHPGGYGGHLRSVGEDRHGRAPQCAAPVPIWGFASTAAAPATLSGPVLVVDVGDQVTITVHNGLADALSLAIPALTGVVPDMAGAASGAAKAYTFPATRPGTYLYEAGHTTNGARQVAMGLYGALVIRGAASGGKPSAYGDAASTYDDEALLVLSEVDPAFNANPAGFDLRSFNPKYRLINGKAFPETDVIATDIGRKVLLRYVNAGLLAHPMTLLGVDQAVIGQDGRPHAYPEGAVTVPMQQGRTADALVSVPGGPDGRRFTLMESGGALNNAGQRYGTAVTGVSPQQAFGGMLTFLDTNPPPVSGDHIGPTSGNVKATPEPASVLAPVSVTADFTDALNGNSIVDSAELVVDDLSVAEGTSSVQFSSASFGTSPTISGATATIPTSLLTTLTQGRHTLYVRAHDGAGNWGVVGSTTVTLSKTGAVTTGVLLNPNPTTGTGDVAISATGDDSGLGGTVTGAEYFLDATATNGTGTPVTLTTSWAVVGEAGTIPAVTAAALPEGRHTVFVHTQDSFGLWGPYGSADLIVDRHGPALLSGAVIPAATNGTNGSPSDPTDLRVNAAFTDPVTGGVNSAVAGAEGFLDNAGADGTGFTFLALDGAFNTPTENTYGLVPLTELTGLADRTHQILVHARDAAGNWGPLTAVTFGLDRHGPVVSAPDGQPEPDRAGGLASPLRDGHRRTITVAGAEWYEGADPGAGLGRPMAVVGSSISATVALNGFAAGAHTF